MSTNAHARSDEIEKIALAQQNSVSVELTAIDAAASARIIMRLEITNEKDIHRQLPLRQGPLRSRD
jgi:hypothetical protein